MAGTGTSWIGRWSWLFIIVVATLPALTLRAGLWHTGVIAETLCFGLAVVAAAFALTWTAEAAEHDIAQALALALLALIAVLPEYAVDLTFAWKAGASLEAEKEYAPFAVANMTGGNRLLVGFGWPVVVLIFYLRSRRTVLELAQTHRLELTFLGIATLYSFTLPLKQSISLVDSAFLIGLFLVYVALAARNPAEEPELMGPAKSIGGLPTNQRRPMLVILFLFAAGVILASAEPFAEGLIHTGTELGVDEFLLVQWVAPLASEAPEFIAAGLMAYRFRAGAGMGALISSKVNQWTLLIGGLPIAFALSRGEIASLPLDDRQIEEVFLTAAQSLFAVGVLVSLSISLTEGGLLASLFIIQAAIPNTTVRFVFAFIYVALAAVIFWHNRAHLRRPWRSWFGQVAHPELPESADPTVAPPH
jgi:cation:H+ antiporter